MSVRLENTETPDLSVFNVAYPKKERLSVFREIIEECGSESDQKSTDSKKKNNRRG